MGNRILRMVIKEFLQMFRDPRMRGIIFLVPVIQSLVFGYAVTMEVKNIKLAIYDKDQTPASREFISYFTGSSYFVDYGVVANEEELNYAIEWYDVRIILHILPGFETNLKRGMKAPVQILIDGSDANSAGIIGSYASQIAENYSREVRRRLGEERPLVELKSRAWFNRNLESRPYFVPGIMAILISLVTLTLTSMAIVREKEIGTIEQILVTPITSFEFIMGKTIPFITIGLIDVVFILIVAVFWFQVPLLGSLLLLFTAIICYLMNTLGLGLLISTTCTTQQQALMSAFLVYFPMTLLSGFIFPVSNMPESVKWATIINPLRHFLVVIRSVFLKGNGWEILWPELLGLFASGLVILTLAVRRFHKTVG